jgi:hypothetical protein
MPGPMNHVCPDLRTPHGRSYEPRYARTYEPRHARTYERRYARTYEPLMATPINTVMAGLDPAILTRTELAKDAIPVSNNPIGMAG